MALNPNHPKNHHYVPQFLLRNFVGKNDRLCVFDKLTERTFFTGTRNIAAEMGFYDFEGKHGGKNSFEGLMARLESRASTIVARILTDQSLNGLTKRDRVDFSIFMAVQKVRVKGVRHRLKALNEDLRKEIVRRGFDPGDVMPEIDDDNVKRIALDELRTAKETAQYFYNKAWILQKAPNGKSFHISDNPVTLHNSVEDNGLGNLGLGCEGIEINLPLSPLFSLLMYCERTTADLFQSLALVATKEPRLGPSPIDTTQLRKLAHCITTGTPDDLLAENVDHLNALQVQYASRFVIAPNDDFDLAKRMIRDFPLLKNPRRLSIR